MPRGPHPGLASRRQAVIGRDEMSPSSVRAGQAGSRHDTPGGVGWEGTSAPRGKEHAMNCLRLSFTERRRARLARRVEVLDLLEEKTTITEPISLSALSLGGWMAWIQAMAMPARAAAPAA